MHFMLWVFTDGLLPLIISGHWTVLYTSYVLPENSSITKLTSHDSESSLSTSHCALQCNRMEECQGLLFDWLTKKRSLKTYIDRNLYSEGRGDGYDFYVAKDTTPKLNTLLARESITVTIHPLRNFAICAGKPAKMASIYVTPYGLVCEAGLAVDGIYNDSFPEISMAHSQQQFRPWWRVDLLKTHCVWAVNILNRKLWVERALNTGVTVTMVEEDIEFTGSNREVQCKYVDGYLNQYYTLITCDQPISGRFVQLLFNATTFVNLYEVEVHGQ